MIGLTPKQLQVKATIMEYRRQNGIAPTRLELAHETGMPSTGGVQRILHILEQRGHLAIDRKAPRGLYPICEAVR